MATSAPNSSTQGLPEAADEAILGRYKVLGQRGTGGFGTVCVCWDTRLQRRVAIKRMPLVDEATGGRTTASTMGEALGEARTACLLAHPNIVTVFDFESDDSYAYLVMEYVDGLDLAEFLQRVEGGALTHDEAAHLLSSMTQALSYAHENGVLHLDIKPTNVMVDRQGVVKLADFGMATLASAAGYGESRGGTVGYMPPEQIRGDLVDERTDVFSLGVVLWQALTGQSPFAADTAEASLKRIERGPRPAIGQLDPELSPEAADALARAVSADAAGRMADVRDLADAVLPSLGVAEQGKASFAQLMSQSDEDDSPAAWSDRHLPLLTRHPWLETAFERALAAFAVAVVAVDALPYALPGADDAGRLLALALVAGATAAWPPVGSMLAGALVAAAFALTLPTRASVPLAAAAAALLVAWWMAAGRRDHMATPCLLWGCVQPVPWLGASLSAWALNPGRAALTGAAGYLLAELFQEGRAAGFSAQATVSALLARAGAPAAWVLLAGATAAALVGSLVTCRGSVRAGIAGQVVGTTLLVAAQVLALGMENGGIWGARDMVACVLALVLCVLLCIACALRGPLEWEQEGD